MDLFRSTSSASAHIRQIKSWVAEAFALPEGATVLVTELRCAEPGCPPLETVIAILSDRERRQFKLHKSAAEIDRADISGLSSS
jgi:hypothetical protein